MLQKILHLTSRSYLNITTMLESFLSPVIMLIIRFQIGMIYLRSGLLKLDSWDSTIYLFTYEHPVPYLEPELAAVLGVFGELFFPALLISGFASRFGAIGIFSMALLIELTYKSSTGHHMQMMLMAVIITMGAGKLSIDHFIRKYFHSKFN